MYCLYCSVLLYSDVGMEALSALTSGVTPAHKAAYYDLSYVGLSALCVCGIMV